jgi:hypothetical protein
LYDRIGEKIFSFLSWLETKIFALLCVLLAGFLTYYSNFFKVLYEHSQIDSGYFYTSLSLYLGAIGVMIYLCFYLPYFKNIDEDKWDSYCPNMIPLATFLGVAGMVTLVICVWDVWGWISIPLILLIKLGFVMTAHFAPGGVLGNLIFTVILIGLILSGYYIDHEGYLH